VSSFDVGFHLGLPFIIEYGRCASFFPPNSLFYLWFPWTPPFCKTYPFPYIQARLTFWHPFPRLLWNMGHDHFLSHRRCPERHRISPIRTDSSFFFRALAKHFSEVSWAFFSKLHDSNLWARTLPVPFSFSIWVDFVFPPST